MKKKLDFSKFRFSGRTEFFEPPLNLLNKYPLIVYAYRTGFARGCRAGADDIINHLKEQIEISDDEMYSLWNATLDAQKAIEEAITYNKNDTPKKGNKKNMNNYNEYPKDMKEMTQEDWDEYFIYCFEKIESRQAYENHNIFEPHEDLRIFWVKEESGLGFATGAKAQNGTRTIKHYRIGSDEAWQDFRNGFAAQFKGDNS